MYLVEKGKGVTVIESGVTRALSMVKHDLRETFIYTSLSYLDNFESGIATFMPQFQKAFRGIRMSGCAGTEIAQVAEHIAGACITNGCSIWDLAPGKLISTIRLNIYD
jgi:fructose-1,6-bisphosphatase/inositol monophosphatase family enzyme